jgi:hypothetical protein
MVSCIVTGSIQQPEQDAAWFIVDLNDAVKQCGDAVSHFDLGAG